MSEVIVQMEMPDWCPCEFAIDNNGWFSPCFAYDGIPSREKEFDDCVENRKRPSWCPIVGALLKGHGPLVDFNDVSKELRKYGYIVKNEATGMQHMEYPIVLEQNPICIPTIVPAEKKDNRIMTEKEK